MTPPIAGVPYARAKDTFHRQDFMQLPSVQAVSLTADGLVVQTTEPTLIPSSFEGLPVRTEAPKGVLRPTNHTLTTVPSPLQGGVAIGDHLNWGTLGGFVWSGGEPWLVTAAHNFESKCSAASPCPPCSTSPCSAAEQKTVKLLHECPQSHANGIPAKIAPERTTPAPPTVSTLTRWTQLTTTGTTTKVDVAAGFVDVNNSTLNRRLAGFSRMVDGPHCDPDAE